MASSSRFLSSVILVAAYFIFVILTAVLNYILPFLTYLLIFAGVLVISVLLYFFSAAAQQAGRWKLPKWPIKTVVGWVIVALLAFLMIWNGILEVPDREIGATELQKLSSGNCKVQGKNLLCTGPFTITIEGPAELTTIGNIKVNPGSTPIKELDIKVGLYLAKYSQGYINDLGGECSWALKDIVYHRVMIYYNGNPRYQGCYPVAVPTGMAPESLWFGTNWLRLTQVFNVEDPYFYVGLEKISTSYIPEIPQAYMQYPVVLSSKQSSWSTTEISSVSVVHSRYKLI